MQQTAAASSDCALLVIDWRLVNGQADSPTSATTNLVVAHTIIISPKSCLYDLINTTSVQRARGRDACPRLPVQAL